MSDDLTNTLGPAAVTLDPRSPSACVGYAWKDYGESSGQECIGRFYYWYDRSRWRLLRDSRPESCRGAGGAFPAEQRWGER
jgi:hypothetical protein